MSGAGGGGMLMVDMVEGPPSSVNPQRRRPAKRAAPLVLAGLLAGCSTFSHYPAGMEQTTLGPLRAGQKTDYSRTFGRRTKGRDKVLFAMEMGRTAQLEKNYAESRAAFEAAMAATQAQDDRAALSPRGRGPGP